MAARHLERGGAFGADATWQELAAAGNSEFHHDLTGSKVADGTRLSEPSGLESRVAQRCSEGLPRCPHGEDRQVPDDPDTFNWMQRVSGEWHALRVAGDAVQVSALFEN
jgi:hypothetical protein